MKGLNHVVQDQDDQDDDYVIISVDDAKLGDNPGPAYASEISSYIDCIANSLWPVNKTIHDNPELNYEEYIAHEALVKFMRSQEGWNVTESAYHIETAWIAVYDSGRKGPVISFNVEMGKPYHYLLTILKDFQLTSPKKTPWLA